MYTLKVETLQMLNVTLLKSLTGLQSNILKKSHITHLSDNNFVDWMVPLEYLQIIISTKYIVGSDSSCIITCTILDLNELTRQKICLTWCTIRAAYF